MSTLHTLTSAREFNPSFLVRHNQIQSVFATKSPRRSIWLRRGNQMEAVQQWQVVDAGGGVRLTGMRSAQAAGVVPKGLVVLIHGWEGSHNSGYLYSMSCALYAAGYNIFRLNLRDHGGSHALNKGIFHSARMDEVLGAIAAVTQQEKALTPQLDLYVIGFSLGGNFSLRVALQGPARGLTPRLCIGVSPAITPGAMLQAIDQGPLVFRRYFMSKWQKTLKAKQAAWPEYDFRPLAHHRRFLDITREFVLAYTDYGSLENYLSQYTLTPDQLLAAPAPVAVITSRDDAVIPFRDFDGLAVRGSVLSYDATRHGGHCGFIENLRMSSWAEERVLQLLQAH